MPPRRAKRDPDLAATLQPLCDSFSKSLDELEAELLKLAKKTAENEVNRVMKLYSKTHQDMLLVDFLAISPPIDLLEENTNAIEEEVPKQPEEKENTPETVESHPEPVENEPQSEHADMDVDDAAHETSIPIVLSGQNSGRSTATRHELVTPAGHVLTVPQTIHPKLDGVPVKSFRYPRIDEEIAFSANGSPIILQSNRTEKRTDALEGLLQPKLEPGTAV